MEISRFSPPPSRKRFLISLFILLVSVLAYLLIIRPCLGIVCVQRSFSLLNPFIHGSHPLEYYQTRTDRFALWAFAALFLAGFSQGHFPRLREIVLDYFKERTSPFNLATFRILFFTFVLYYTNRSEILWFSGMPENLRVQPLGTGLLFSVIPVDPDHVRRALFLFTLFCSSALVGLFTRTSCLLSGVCGLYLFAIPQCFGKVDHSSHHLVWFMFLFGSSKCGDVLSLDSLRKAFQEADRGGMKGNEPSVEYSLPLRWMWLLMGIIYFFPGLWKSVEGGWAWIFSENLRYKLYWVWSSQGYLPFFRLDEHPWLYHGAAAGTILFELGFIVLVLFPFMRPALGLSGLLFHNMTNQFMRIAFFSLQMCYLSFINWDDLFTRSGKFLFPKTLTILYDGNCKLCRRTIQSIRKFDLLRRTQYVNALDFRTREALGFGSIDENELLRDMHAVIGEKRWLGYEAYRQLAPRIPLFWPLVPLLWLWPVSFVGRKIYRKVADSRLCTIPVPVKPAAIPNPTAPPRYPLSGILGLGLLSINALFGLAHQETAWPFACYPTFSWVDREARWETLGVFGVSGKSEMGIPLQPLLISKMSPDKVNGIIARTLASRDETEKGRRSNGIVQLLEESGADLKGYSLIRFYRMVYDTHPGLKDPLLLKEPFFDLSR